LNILPFIKDFDLRTLKQAKANFKTYLIALATTRRNLVTNSSIAERKIKNCSENEFPKDLINDMK